MTLHMTAPLEIGIGCLDLDQIRSFYENVLGFSFISESKVSAEIAKGLGLCACGYRVARLQTPFGERLKFLMPDKPASSESNGAYVLSRHRATYLTFIIEDLETVLQKLVDAGVVFPAGTEIKTVRPGIRAVFCRDPEGNNIELVQVDDIDSYRPDLKKNPL